MLINWPSFNAAPLILDSFDTSRETFDGVMMSEEDVCSSSPERDRRKTSVAAPYPRDAARPATYRYGNVIITICEIQYLRNETNDQYGRKAHEMLEGSAEGRIMASSLPLSANQVGANCMELNIAY